MRGKREKQEKQAVKFEKQGVGMLGEGLRIKRKNSL